jgi:hypothetical protein
MSGWWQRRTRSERFLLGGLLLLTLALGGQRLVSDLYLAPRAALHEQSERLRTELVRLAAVKARAEGIQKEFQSTGTREVQAALSFADANALLVALDERVGKHVEVLSLVPDPEGSAVLGMTLECRGRLSQLGTLLTALTEELGGSVASLSLVPLPNEDRVQIHLRCEFGHGRS